MRMHEGFGHIKVGLLHSEAALVPSHLNNLHSEHAAVVHTEIFGFQR